MPVCLCCKFRRFGDDRSGATIVEYALLAALLSLGVLGTYQTMSGQIAVHYDTLGQEINDQP